jgi:hypothetical protein
LEQVKIQIGVDARLDYQVGNFLNSLAELCAWYRDQTAITDGQLKDALRMYAEHAEGGN